MDPAQQAVAALLALGDGELARVVAAATDGRPALVDLRDTALAAAAAAWGHPDPTPEIGPPGPPGDVTAAPAPEVVLDGELVTDGPADSGVADPGAARIAAAAGASELDAESTSGRATAAAWEERQRAGRDRLARIRAAMGGQPDAGQSHVGQPDQRAP